MKTTLQYSLVLLILLVSSPLRAGIDSEPALLRTDADSLADREAIIAVLEKQLRAFADRSFEGEAAVWSNSPNIVRIAASGGGMQVGWEQIGQTYQTWFSENPEPTQDFGFTHYDIHLNIHGDAAWVVYKQHMEGMSGDQVIDITSREVRFLERTDGEWRIVFQFTEPIDTVEEDM